MAVPLEIVCVVIGAGLSSAGLVFLARATRSRHHMSGTKDVETAYIAAVSTLYGIFIAFMIFTVWQRYSDAREDAAAEASALAEVYRVAGALPQPMRGDIERLSVEYGQSVVKDEWPAMRHGDFSPRTEAVVERMWQRIDALGPPAVSNAVIQDHLLTAWARTTTLRRTRLLRSTTGLPEHAYAILIVGGLITLGLASIFTVDNLSAHIIKAASLSAMVALMLAAIWGLDHPFSSRVRIQPEAFTRILAMVQSRH